ncbi:antibiotic biosynthesis monooxygenase [Halolamina sediminis]|uniref:antibiotic biosynthesis monooxygenase n=1 Tax=Halolamina sediminis TaxID=1480675 RepID=UPI001F2A17E3|nr:antibiotic biosynthesis monooxygenase [Halolamina sediminis]
MSESSEPTVEGGGAIVRVWHGWTEPEDADAYELFLTDAEEGLLATMSGDGYLGYDLLRREDGDEVEFVTQIRFADYDAVAAFAGEDYEQAHVPDTARELLTRWDDGAVHYDHRASERA